MQFQKTKRWFVLLVVVVATLLYSGVILFIEAKDDKNEQLGECIELVNSLAENVLESDLNINERGYSDMFSLDNTLNLFTDSAFVGAFDFDSNTVLYYTSPSGEVFKNCSFEEAGIDRSRLFGNGDNIVRLNDGKEYLVFTKSILTDNFGDITIAYFILNEEYYYPEYTYGFILSFFFAAIVVAAYTIFLKAEAERNNTDGSFRGKTRNRILLLIAGCGLFIFALGFFLTNIISIAVSRDMYAYQKDVVNNTLISSLKINEIESKKLAEEVISSAKAAANNVVASPERVLGNGDSSYIYYEYNEESGVSEAINDSLGNPTESVCSSSFLISLCKKYNIEEIRIYDCNGRIIASSSDIWNGTLEIDSFRDTLYRKTQSCSSEVDNCITVGVPINLYVKTSNGRTVYCSSKDEDAVLEYGLLTAKNTCPDEHLSYNDCFRDTIRSLEPIMYSNIVMTEKTGNGFRIIYESEDFSGMSLEDLGLGSDEAFGGNYLGTIKVKDNHYLIKCVDSGLDSISQTQNGAKYYYSFFIEDDNFGGASLVVSTYIPYTLISLVFLLFVAIFISKMKPEDAVVLDGGSNLVIPDYQDEDIVVDFHQRNCEQKLFDVIKVCLRIIIGIILVYGIICVAAGFSNSIFWHILYGNWDCGGNFISITASIMCLLVIRAGIFIIGKIFFFLSKNLSAKAQTFCRLAVSIIKYIGVIFWIFYSLYLFGMDVRAVLTSLGAFSILIGLGAQSLIKDILAGFFLLVEGQFKIGDIITVGNYTGRVKEIGLRSTKCENLSGDITIFSNSSINQLENHSKKLSRAFVDSTISMSIPLSTFEEALKKEIPAMEKRMKDYILGDITYDGVISFDAKTKIYTIRVSAACRELDRGKVKHELSKEVLSLCYNCNQQ